MNEKELTQFVRDVLVGNIIVNDMALFEKEIDIICSPQSSSYANSFEIYMDDGTHFLISISDITRK
jgi:hypothetical protein